jgi:hypothetical protein
MAEARPVVEAAIERGDTSRRAVLRAIRQHEREHTTAVPDEDLADVLALRA